VPHRKSHRRAPGRRRRGRIGLTVAAFMAAAMILSAMPAVSGARAAHQRAGVPAGLEKIDHIVFIVQENRSFDHYFGTYPGADGIPKTTSGAFAASTCNYHPVLKKCLKPYHATSDIQTGGPHAHRSSVIDRASGSMNGFIKGAASSPLTKKCVLQPLLSSCQPFEGPAHQPDVMSYRTRADIPNYWALADWGVLQDHLFASVDSFSLPSHTFIFSGWAANCSGGPMTCKGTYAPDITKTFNWTPIPYLLDAEGVSWAWYVGEDTVVNETCYPDCPESGSLFTPANWNPPPGFKYIKDASYTVASHVKSVDYFRQALTSCASASCTDVPAVSWVIPGEKVSEHPGKGSMKPGYNYVSKLIDDIGSSPVWGSTAVFLYWDDWGGFYDHVSPVKVDGLGYGIRVPGIMISPYAKQGFIDHQVLSPDAMLKLVEDRFLDGKRLDPSQSYMPADNRPVVREDVAKLGDLYAEFNFNQAPRPAPVLPG
jgi:phospholipase C